MRADVVNGLARVAQDDDGGAAFGIERGEAAEASRPAVVPPDGMRRRSADDPAERDAHAAIARGAWPACHGDGARERTVDGIELGLEPGEHVRRGGAQGAGAGEDVE